MTSIKQIDLIKEIEKLGAERIRVGGKHIIYKLNGGIAAVPHGRKISPGTRRDIYKNLCIQY